MKLEAIDEDGVKTSMEFEGDLDKEVILERISKFIEALDLPSKSSTESSSGALNSKNIEPNKFDKDNLEDFTIKERLKYFLLYEFRDNWFTSTEVKRQYDSTYGEIGLSTVSTYLSRMAKNGFLKRRGNRVEREYKIAEENNQETHKMSEIKEALDS